MLEILVEVNLRGNIEDSNYTNLVMFHYKDVVATEVCNIIGFKFHILKGHDIQL